SLHRGSIAASGALLLILMTLMALAGDRMSALESAFYDFLQQQQPAVASNRIILVDTATGNGAGTFWDAGEFGPVIDALNTAGAALIVPLKAPPANTQLPDIKQLTALAELEKRARKSSDGIKDAALSKQLAGLQQQHEQHQAIATTVRDAGNIVLPIIARPTLQELENAKDECRRHTVSATGTGSSDNPPWVREAAGTLTLPEVLCSGAVNTGYAGYWPDMDGVVRRNHLLVRSGQRIFPSLSLAVAQADEKNADLQIDGEHNLLMATHNINTGPGFTNLVRYYMNDRSQQVFRSISARELLSTQDTKSLFKNNIVLVGDLSSSRVNKFRTPSGELIPLPVLVATTLSNLLQMDFVSRPYWLGSAELAILLFIGIVILFSAPTLNANHAIIATLVLATILLAIEAYILMTHGIWLQLVTVTLFSVLAITLIQALISLGGTNTLTRLTGAAKAAPASKLHDQDKLDLAFSVLRQQEPTAETKQRLYDIAMTHGKQREYAKAERVLLHIYSIDNKYLDVQEKLKKLSGARKRNLKRVTQSRVATDQSAKNKVLATGSSERKLGPYIIEKTLGRGAMATVYLGRDPKINRQVAIKTIALAEEFSDADVDAVKVQFIRETESAGRLNHPNIITIYGTGEDQNVAYLAMEYFQGKALNLYTHADSLLPPKRVIELTARAAEALHYAHGQGVIHRDIKPANLMYNATSDELRITDFGIARLTDTSRTKTGIILGTPSYMSPEQLAANDVTGVSDLYSLGITMYQLLTGMTPFRSDSIQKLMDKIMHDQHTPVSRIRDDLPPGIDAVLDRMLNKKPENRFQNGRAVAVALRDCFSALET
ncbi:MAG: serine/threonine-protein kinase, partial [Gammaproteobacteria bacterium]|nr:serine/threonine-protein kinase [Gammaproteobacteria bacterium]